MWLNVTCWISSVMVENTSKYTVAVAMDPHISQVRSIGSIDPFLSADR